MYIMNALKQTKRVNKMYKTTINNVECLVKMQIDAGIAYVYEVYSLDGRPWPELENEMSEKEAEEIAKEWLDSIDREPDFS